MSDNDSDLLWTVIKVGGAAAVLIILFRLLLFAAAFFRFILIPLAIIIPIALLVGLYRLVEQAPKHYDSNETGRVSRTVTEDVTLSDDDTCHVCMTDSGSGVRETTIREFAFRGNAVLELSRSTEAYCDEHHITPESLDEDLDRQFDEELNEELQEDMLEDN